MGSNAKEREINGAVFREREGLLKLEREREMIRKMEMIVFFRVIFLVFIC